MPDFSLAAAVLYVGHSLVNHDLPAMLEGLVASQRGGGTVEEQIINGAPLRWNWEHSAEGEAGIDARAILARGETDVFVMTEGVPLRVLIDYKETQDYALRWYDAAVDANPQIRVYMYESWEDITSGPGADIEYDPDDQIPWRKRIDQELALWETAVDHVNDNNDPGDPDMLMIPAGQAMGRMYDAIGRGEVPGVTRLSDLYQDNIHLNDLGHYFVALVHYATIYGRSPEGLPRALKNQWGEEYDRPSPALAAKMQAIAWDVVRDFAQTGFVLEGTSGKDTLSGTAKADILRGAAGNDMLIGKGNSDLIYGGRGSDKAFGGKGNDRIFGGEGDDGLSGQAGRDALRGGDGEDALRGGRGADALMGNAGDDRLIGGAGGDGLFGGRGRDILLGGTGADTMGGGAGRDVFVFRASRDSLSGKSDTIRDFARGKDKLDFRKFDDRSSPQDDHGFEFVGRDAFSGTAAELRFQKGKLRADADGDGRTDFIVKLENIANLSESDLLL